MSLDKKQMQIFIEYVRELADQMGLRDWELNLRDSTPEKPKSLDGTSFLPEASCEATPGQRYAFLQIDHEYARSVQPEHLRYVLTHELLHCHFALMAESARIGLLDQLSQSTYDMFMYNFTANFENGIDAVARSWCVSLPVIKWGEK
jgi:hypothetical protein